MHTRYRAGDVTPKTVKRIAEAVGFAPAPERLLKLLKTVAAQEARLVAAAVRARDVVVVLLVLVSPPLLLDAPLQLSTLGLRGCCCQPADAGVSQRFTTLVRPSKCKQETHLLLELPLPQLLLLLLLPLLQLSLRQVVAPGVRRQRAGAEGRLLHQPSVS